VISKKKTIKNLVKKLFSKKQNNYQNVNLTLTNTEADNDTTTILTESSFDQMESFTDNESTIMHSSGLKERLKISKIINSSNPEKRQKKLDKYAIVCNNLCKTYDNGKEALKYLNLKIKKGEVYGLLGPNGAGKTTLISIITGFLEKTSGKFFVDGLDMDEHKLPKKLALCPQFNIQWPNLTVSEHLIIFGLLRNIPWKNVHSLVKEIIKKVDLEDKKDIEASKLSGGMRRRLSIAIALMGNTEIIFLDEPTTGLDPKRRRELWHIIKSIREEKTFIISTHLMEEAEFLCDQIGIMTLGQLRAVGTANFLKEAFVNYFQVELTLKEEHEFWTEELKNKLKNALGGKIRYEFGQLIKVQIDNDDEKSYLEIFKSVGKCKDFVKSWSLKSGSLEDAFGVIEGLYK
jgi:ABC-type multidrug transport system ATPase subunit